MICAFDLKVIMTMQGPESNSVIVCAAIRQAHVWLQVANHEPSDDLLRAQMLEGDLLGQHLP